MKKRKQKLKVLNPKDMGKVRGGQYHKHEDGTVGNHDDGCPPPEPIKDGSIQTAMVTTAVYVK